MEHCKSRKWALDVCVLVVTLVLALASCAHDAPGQPGDTGGDLNDMADAYVDESNGSGAHSDADHTRPKSTNLLETELDGSEASRVGSFLLPTPGFVRSDVHIRAVWDGDVAAVAADLEAHLAAHPESGAAAFELGAMRWRQGDGPAALALLRSVGDTRPVEAEVSEYRLHIVADVIADSIEDALGPDPDGLLTPIDLGLSPDRVSGFGSVAVGDVNGDGYPDVFTHGAWSGPHLFLGTEQGELVDVSWTAGFNPNDRRGCFSALFGDVDRDGDLDLFLARGSWFGPVRNDLLLNDGLGHFRDASEAAGIVGADDSFVSNLVDYDLDGDLDIFVGNGISEKGTVQPLAPGHSDRLWRNDGEGHFTDVAEAVGLSDSLPNVGAAWFDADDDGDPDLFTARMGGPNAFYRNDGGQFTDVLADLPEHPLTAPQGPNFMAMPFDYDNDGDLDLLVTAIFPNNRWGSMIAQSRTFGFDAEAGNRLFQNTGEGTMTERFVEVTTEARLNRVVAAAMGAGIADIDNDGWLDIKLANGNPALWRLDRPALVTGSPEGVFTDRTLELGIRHFGKGHGVVFWDRDGDGDLELYSQLGAYFEGDVWPDVIYDNRTSQRTSHSWLQVELEGTHSNPDAFGAVVRATVGELTMTRILHSGYGFGATDWTVLHFGLGDADHVDELTITWPDGEGTVQSLGRVEANQRLRVVEP